VTIVPVANTKQIPGKGPMLCVQAANDADALRELTAIAAKRGYTLGETVYRYGAGYFYCPINSIKEGVQS
jgi:hypothetical protein